ncbi:MAG TPA: hypothetical protein VK636_03520, partial [Gemmatimonadaceae bacterium]|nr:hypothetical protein [Gemmatimonadaceae bacterium]
MSRTSAASLLVGFALCSAATSASAQAALTPHQKLAREIYAELVSINSSDSVGSVTRAAEAMAKRFRTAGFPAGDIQLLVPPGKPT